MTTVPLTAAIFPVDSDSEIKSPHSSAQASLTNISSWSVSESAWASAASEDLAFLAGFPDRHDTSVTGEGMPCMAAGLAAAIT